MDNDPNDFEFNFQKAAASFLAQNFVLLNVAVNLMTELLIKSSDKSVEEINFIVGQMKKDYEDQARNILRDARIE